MTAKYEKCLVKKLAVDIQRLSLKKIMFEYG